jgi:hypothetical protein
MGWYICGGCGASVRCDVCSATECSQDIWSSDCAGCKKALKLKESGIPWNMKYVYDRRPVKHLRKVLGRIRRHKIKFLKYNHTWGLLATHRNYLIHKDKRSMRVRFWSALSAEL